MGSDWAALAASYVYVFAVLAIGELLRRWKGYPIAFTRKFVHVGVGMWSLGTVALFANRFWAMIPPLSFIALNYASYKRNLFSAMETGEKENLGTVYFPISFTLIILWLWPRPELLVASLMPMTWGDASAAIVGNRFGRHKYRLWGSERSLEGSAAMFLMSWLAVALVLGAMTAAWSNAVVHAAILATIATLVEAITPWHIDNLTVPLVSALVLGLWLG